MDRQIIHLRLLRFYVEAHRRAMPGVNGQPLLVADGHRIIDLSDSAEAKGLTTSHTPNQVTSVCPQALLVPYQEDRYQDLYRAAWDVLAQHTPMVEPEAFHRGYADLTGSLRQGEDLHRRCEAIRAQIRKATDLDCLLGAGATKFVARLASHPGWTVLPEDEPQFLNNVPLKWVEDLNEETRRRLVRLGLRTLGDLRKVSRTALAHQFGEQAQFLWSLARGLNGQPVQPLYPPPHLEQEVVFPNPERDALRLQAHLLLAAQELWQALAKQGQAVNKIELTLFLQKRDSNPFSASHAQRPALLPPEKRLLSPFAENATQGFSLDSRSSSPATPRLQCRDGILLVRRRSPAATGGGARPRCQEAPSTTPPSPTTGGKENPARFSVASGFTPDVIPRRGPASAGPAVATLRKTQSFPRPLDTPHRLTQAALSLFRKTWNGAEVTSLSLRASDLTRAEVRQLTLWDAKVFRPPQAGYVPLAGADGNGKREMLTCGEPVEPLEQAMEAIRRRHGARSINRGAQADLPRPRMAELILQEQVTLWS